MSALDLISERLEHEKGFAPVAHALREQLPGAPSMLYSTYFGASIFVAPLEADDLSEQDLTNLVRAYRELLAGLRSSLMSGPFARLPGLEAATHPTAQALRLLAASNGCSVGHRSERSTRSSPPWLSPASLAGLSLLSLDSQRR